MLDQVLTALLGYPGQHIYEDKNGEFILSIESTGDLISLAEKTLIEKIVKLGAICNRLDRFVKTTQQIQLRSAYFDATTKNENNIDEELDWRRSVYVSAWANGINKTLQEYRSDVCVLEQKVHTSPHLFITTFIFMNRI